MDFALNQTATYWGTPVNSGYGGKTFATPTTLDCRWEDKQELIKNAAGDEVMSVAIVIMEDDVDLEGFLYLGTSTESSPYDVAGAKEIIKFDKVPSLDASEFYRAAYL